MVFGTPDPPVFITILSLERGSSALSGTNIPGVFSIQVEVEGEGRLPVPYF